MSWEQDNYKPVNLEPPTNKEINIWIDELHELKKIYFHQVGIKPEYGYGREIFFKLIDEEFIRDKALVDFGELLATEIQNRHPTANAGVVLLGSAIHGTSLIREVFERESILMREDFDLGIVFDRDSLDKNDLEKIESEMEGFLKNSIQIFKICSVFKPSKINICNLTDEVEALRVLTDNVGQSDDYKHSHLLYFEPSYPPEVNQTNLKYITSGLEKLSVENFQQWHHIVKNVLKSWYTIHAVKVKHFPWNENEVKNIRLLVLLNKVDQQSGQMMSGNMRNLLSGTNKNQQYQDFAWWQ